MENCINCGTEPTVPVTPCDCQCVNVGNTNGNRDIRLIAPTRDTATAWSENDPLVPEGVLCLVKDRLFEGSLEYFIGDGEHKYSELTMLYAGAPLSRTGAANHSPLAAEGKSTLDPSWLPAATSSTLGAVMVSTTGAAGKVPIAAAGASSLDPSWLPTSVSGAANKIPIAGSNGKLDPTWFPEATSTTLGAVKASTTTAANNVVKADGNGSLDGWKDAIIDAIIADDGSGGLVTDGNGNLAVDFSQMPTDKFEDLLKSLKMLIPLSSNKDLFVDTNSAAASDNIVDGRGTEALPFKTIQGAVNYATSTYSVGSRTLNIKVKAGTYNESVTLPEYSYGTGGIVIKPASGQKDVIVEAPVRSDGLRYTCIGAVGGKWSVERIIAHRVENPTTATSFPVVGCFAADGNATRLYLTGCSAIQALPVDPTILNDSNNYTVRVIAADQGAQIRIYPDTVPFEISTAKNSDTYPSVAAISVLRNSNITNVGTSTNDYDMEIDCSGSCDVFFQAGSKSQYDNLSGPNLFTFVGNVTGKKFTLTGASCTNITGGDADFFPGDVAGTLDASTYCYYA